MNAFAAVVVAHQIASIWALATLAAWLLLYATSKGSDHPDAAPRSS
jgi:hypothetical protein